MPDTTIPRREKLCEGVFLNLISHDKTKTNHLSLNFLSDLTEERAAYGALLARVLTRGCAKYPSLNDISAHLDTCYGATLDMGVDKYGETHVLSLTCDWLKDRYAYDAMPITDTVLETARQILLYPLLKKSENGLGFDNEYVQSEKENLFDAIDAEINNKASYARKRMYQIMCEDEPFSVSVLGKKETVSAVTPQSLYAFYQSVLKHTQIEIYFAGSGIDEQKLKQTLGGFFTACARTPASLLAPVQKEVSRTVCRDETMDINQAHLVIGFRTGVRMQDAAYPAFTVFNALFGGAVSSRLFAVIREKMHLCYTVNSSPESVKGTMLVYAGIAAENKECAYKGIMEQLSALSAGDFTDKELEDARAYMISVLRGLCDSPSSLAAWYLARGIGRVDNPSPEKSMEAVLSVTRDDVIAAAGGIREACVYFLAPERRTV